MDHLLSQPAPGAPLTSRALAHLALGVAARETSDFARGLVPTGPARSGYDGALLADAVRIAELAQRVLAAAVVVERADGTTWEEIGEALGITRQSAHKRWQPTVAAWDDQLEQASTPGPGAEDDPVARAAGPTLVAAELDEWVVRHREPRDPIEGEHPVSEVLELMDPLRELLHLAGVRRQLSALHDGQPPAAALARLLEREAVLEEAVAAAATVDDTGEH
jgi:hypothetical protein